MAARQGIRLQHLLIVWFAIVNSVLVYAVVAWIVIGGDPDASTARLYGFVSNPLSFALAIAALAAFFASFIVPGRIIASRRRENRSSPGMGRPSDAFEVPPEISVALTVRFVLLEAPAVIGLVGALIMNEWRFYLPFGVLALLGLLMTAPTASLIRSLDESYRR